MHLRPDILITEVKPSSVQGCTRNGRRTGQIDNAEEGMAHRVWIIEVGYCSDTRYEDKLRQKREQHRLLEDLLTRRGFKVIYLPIILGNAGAIYKTTESALLQLGISHKQVQGLLSKLSDHATRYLHSLVKTRRHLENSNARAQEPPDPP